MVKPILIHWIILLPLILVLLPSNSRSKEKPFRPKVGEFPPLEKAHSYKGELTFVDHANRRGSIRIDGDGRFRFAAPSPFALLPYGLVRYHGSPADLRDIPLRLRLRSGALQSSRVSLNTLYLSERVCV